MLKIDKNLLNENGINGRNPPCLDANNVFKLVKHSFNSHLLIPVEMKLHPGVKTSKNISTTPAVVKKGRFDAALQGKMEVSI